MRYQDLYQFGLICFACLVLFGVATFAYREMFPQYKIYQHAYEDLEKFRSGYSNEQPATFRTGIKQILISHEGQGGEVIDRCVSCHMAMDLPHFSPTRVAFDVNHQQMVDAQGNPILEPNPDYVWEHLDERLKELTHPAVIEELLAQGKKREASKRLKQAEKLAALKTVHVEGREIAVEKVIQMHPLIGSETRPFEFHPMDKYGCTCCHGGNGRAVEAMRAHGPLFDGEYAPAHQGHQPQFTEIDPENDPPFSKMYNHKPGHELIFQTTPILAGPLVEAKCVQCHEGAVKTAVEKVGLVANQKASQLATLQQRMENNQTALTTLSHLSDLVEKGGREGALDWLEGRLQAFHLCTEEREALEGQLAYVKQHEEPSATIQEDIEKIQNSESATKKAYEEGKEALSRFIDARAPIVLAIQDKSLIKKLQSSASYQLTHYQRGKELYISQACYGCHRIAGFSRNNVGPELTKAGLSYPWYLKESIVWPQADLPSSTMPNFRLDHEELTDLMTFLMAQRGGTQAISEVDYHIQLNEWEKGAKMPWEQPSSPTDIRNVRAGQLIFASEGCASCHKLAGFESNCGLTLVAKQGATFQEKLQEREWFCHLFPEQIPGSTLAKIVEEHAEEIDQHIGDGIGQNGILEEIEEKNPGLISSFYTHFKFASRAYDTAYRQKPERLKAYKERLHRVLMVYIQEYGFGRDIAPHLNWSGVWRDNEWLLGHFHNPTAYTAKSLMPVMPFDDTKFYMLNHMLHVLGAKNRERIREVWQEQGFNPSLAFQALCSSCHGEQRQGNGMIAEWIFPIPKNLRNPIFLKNLTKERAIHSITHGVKGTPMPPWGEAISAAELGDSHPVLTEREIAQLADWLFQDMPGQTLVGKGEAAKWRYQPSHVVEEMAKERIFPYPPPSRVKDVATLVDEYFEVRPNPLPGVDQGCYYIREKYYTPQNLEKAEQFYLVNCAVCHGKEGAGTGARAASMVEAKPRVFTDIPWIRSEDDMFLMRSIKYGVPGTAMVAWGDQTTAEQRMGLAMYIRSLSRSTCSLNVLQQLLFDTFDRSLFIVEEARLNAYQKVAKLGNELQSLQNALDALRGDIPNASAEAAGSLYLKVYNLEIEVKKAKEVEGLYQKILAALKEERGIYGSVGEQIITANLPPALMESYFEMIRTQPLVYKLEQGQLVMEKQKENPALVQSALALLEETIADYQQKIDLEKNKRGLAEQESAIEALKEKQTTYLNLKSKLSEQLANASRAREKQQKLFLQLQSDKI
jgi:mono/diheme cytochrome c family protein